MFQSLLNHCSSWPRVFLFFSCLFLAYRGVWLYGILGSILGLNSLEGNTPSFTISTIYYCIWHGTAFSFFPVCFTGAMDLFLYEAWLAFPYSGSDGWEFFWGGRKTNILDQHIIRTTNQTNMLLDIEIFFPTPFFLFTANYYSRRKQQQRGHSSRLMGDIG